jgi:hypothetical protein
LVEVASMKITGTLDSTGIENSLRRIEQKMSGFKGQTESSFASLSRVGNVVSSLTKGLIALGIAGVTAMVGLASKAPAVAPALAKMQISFMEMSHTLGRLLMPFFESLANNLLPSIVSLVDTFGPEIRKLAEAGAYAVGLLAGAVNSMAESKNNLQKILTTPRTDLTSFVESSQTLVEQGIITPSDAAVGVSGAVIADIIQSVIQKMFGSLTEKEQAFTSKNGVG